MSFAPAEWPIRTAHVRFLYANEIIECLSVVCAVLRVKRRLRKLVASQASTSLRPPETWMAGTSPAMTAEESSSLNCSEQLTESGDQAGHLAAFHRAQIIRVHPGDDRGVGPAPAVRWLCMLPHPRKECKCRRACSALRKALRAV